jgi:hypothetical protein
VRTPIVRNGNNDKYVNGDHIYHLVYGEMLLQICMDYPSLPDPRTLKRHEIKFFYEGLRASLKKTTGK